MNGRYRIKLANTGSGILAERITRKRWSVFVRTCESLASDGLTYSVSFTLAGDDPHILITASGQATVKRKGVKGPRHGVVLPLKPMQCAIYAQEPNGSCLRIGNGGMRTRRIGGGVQAAMPN
jgi:hypothetical protein